VRERTYKAGLFIILAATRVLAGQTVAAVPPLSPAGGAALQIAGRVRPDSLY